MMDLNEAAVFVKVVQADGFSAAARLLELPTSTVSNRVARLEQRLGVTLLQRTTRRLNLTEAGKLYFERASIGLAHLLEAEEAVGEVAAQPCGLLRVTAPADIGDEILGSILRQMCSQYPGVNVDLILTNRYVDLIAEGVDVAIRTGHLKDSTLIARNMGVACWAAYASPDYLASADELDSPHALRRHRCLQFTSMGKEEWTFHSSHGSITVPMTNHVVVNDIGVIRAMLLAGDGIALLPTYLCQQSCDEGKLARVLPQWHAKADPIHIVYPQHRFLLPRLRAFVDLASQELQKWLQ